MKKMAASIQWTDARKQIPKEWYSAPAEFEEHPDTVWGVRLQLYNSIDAKLKLYHADVWLLVDSKERDEWLHPGAKLTLYEGTTIVAVVECTHEVLTLP